MRKIWLLFDSTVRLEFVLLILLILVSTLLEAVSISLLLPIIVSLSENNFYDLYPKFGFFFELF